MATSESEFGRGRRSPCAGGRLCLAAALALPALASRLESQIVALGGEIEVSRPSSLDQGYPEVDADRRGGWGVAWSVRDPSNFQVGGGRMRLLNRDDSSVSGSLRDFELEFPTIGLDGSGRGVVVGIRKRSELGGVELDAQCLDSTGRLRGDAVRVDSGAISPRTRVPTGAQVAVDTDGDFVVVWQEDPQIIAPPSVYFRRFDADCRALGDVQSLGAVGSIARRLPQVARSPQGGFALVWLEGWGAEAQRVVTQLFDAQGAAIAPAFSEPHGGREAQSADVVVALSGEVAVAWSSDSVSSISGLDRLLFTRVLGSDGAPLGEVVSLRTPRELQLGSPLLAAVGDRFLAVWPESGGGQAESAVYGRLFDATGPIGGEHLLLSPGLYESQRVLRMAASSETEFVLVWATPFVGDTPPRIVARRFALVPSATACVESSTALCLDGGRFRVSIEWRDFQDHRGIGRSRAGSDASGLFWFFDDANLEVLVKMVDACAEFSRHWFFAAATTNTEYTLRVTDTATGRSRTYFNRLGANSPAITDTNAFATCP